MGLLFETVRRLVAGGRYVIDQHAVERLEERGLLEWQVVDGVGAGAVIAEHPRALPNPSVEVRQVLPDGTEVKAV